MTKTIEEIVARIERQLSTPDFWPERINDCRTIIASWCERGEALEGFVTWSEAYPTDIFPEPDLTRAHEVLKAAGMTLDGISAHIMRRALEEIGKRARAALADTPEAKP